MMAQYFQVIDQGEKTEELQTIYPNPVENQPQAVRYVFKSDDQSIPANQPIIVTSNDQYMVIDNSISFQNQQFDVQPGQRQIYYMESEENGGVSQSVVLNHQMTSIPVTAEGQVSTSPQKVIMVQQGGQNTPQAMLIQQPLVQRQIQVQKNVQQRLPPPQLMITPRTAIPQNAAQRSMLVQGANGLNLVRSATPRMQQRVSSPSVSIQGADSSTRPNLPSRINVNKGNAPRSVRAGVIQTNTPPRASILQGNPRVLTPRPTITQRKPNLAQNSSTTDLENVVLRDGRVVSMAEFNKLLDERIQESPVANKPTVGKPPPQRPSNKRVTARNPISRTTQNQPPAPSLAPPTPQPNPPPPVQQKPPPQMGVMVASPTQSQNPMQKSSIGRIIQSPNQDNNKLPSILRNFVPPPEIKEIISKTQHTPEFNNSIRMFVLLANGEQRLITFTIPKEDCTIHEILDQVGVPLQPDTKIAITETNIDGINLVVTVGITDDDEVGGLPDSEEPSSQPQPEPEPAVPELSAPEPETPKYITGRLAVCTHCGFLSDDFNKCIRCKSKLPDGIKSVPSLTNQGRKSDLMKNKPTIAIHLKNNGSATKAVPKKKPEKKKVVDQEPVILTLSSDEEEEETEDKLNPKVEQLIKKAESEMHESVLKEPTITELNQNSVDEGKEEETEVSDVSTSMFCRTVRIGSYRFTPAEHVLITTKELIIKVPMPKDPTTVKTICIKRNSIVKVLVNFHKMLPVVFYYVVNSMAELVRKELQMEEGKEPYFDPLSSEDAFRRITLLPDNICDESKFIFKTIYGKFNVLEELSTKEANNILVRTCPKEITKTIQTRISSSNNSDVKQLLIYPPGKGGLSINTEDYLCLAQDQFLNDVIIDFYLKYLVLNLPTESQAKVHVFSTFFYKRLTTKPAKPTRKSHPTELDPLLSAAQKRHCRVKNWTKNVNIFEKDFIVVPINENAHWFLAIICFPGMDGPHTFDNKPYKIEPVEKIKKPVATIGSVTITQLEVKKMPTVACDESDLSDKDEAEGDESELDSGEESEETPQPPPSIPETPKTRTPIKQPCILIFDSLAGASRARVVATLRDYLSCEYKAKIGTVKVFNKDVIKGACPKVPQQTNYTDCGLYLLQYVEQFFLSPIRDYHIPINELKTWFEEIIVTRKREDISDLIKDLMMQYEKDITLLPTIMFPTLNGELVDEHSPEEEEEEFEDEEGEEEAERCEEEEGDRGEEEEEEEEYTDSSDKLVNSSPLKPTSESSSVNNSFVEEPMDSVEAKPDLKEVPTPSARDTMSYLKSKRIVRHKPNENNEAKKLKLSQD